jgi:protein-tyrosine phosphatase
VAISFSETNFTLWISHTLESDLDMEYNLLFVCSANICRSPMAEGLAQQLASKYNLQIQAKSAGTMGIVAQPSAPNSIKAMREMGIDITSIRSKGVTSELMEWASYVLVMENKHASTLRRRFPEYDEKILLLGSFGGVYTVDDPIGRWIFAFRKCRSVLIKSIEGFYTSLQSRI